MSLLWLIVLVIYGFTQGWSQIPALSWWILIPMVNQDFYDAQRK